MFSCCERRENFLGKKLCLSLILTTEIIEHIARTMYSGDDCRWERTVLGHTFSMSRASCSDCNDGAKTLVTSFKSWLHAHEEAQVMLASILVVIGLWWLVRTVLALLINLVCPILVVLLAVICVPQLREPLLGQNYPHLANILRNILMKMADNIQT
ncbi:uncharacterized protein [Epargyreus clarus]|uniref:uncharacterized protein n=1 Tax=Epargyreus clarus TaxID=520877 RepID=UPI003C2FE635